MTKGEIDETLMPVISWQKRNNISFQNIADNADTLHISPLKASDADTYFCHVSFDSTGGNESTSIAATCKSLNCQLL